MSNFKLRLLIYFATISASTLLISNLAAVKLWNFFGIAVDGGVVVFPITYIIGDLIVEFYGKKIAKNIILAGFFINILAIIVFYIVIALPPYEGWTMQAAMASVLGFTPRIIADSICLFKFPEQLYIHKIKKRKRIFRFQLYRACAGLFSLCAYY